jgi:DNA-binding transcriptional MocR family regulator
MDSGMDRVSGDWRCIEGILSSRHLNPRAWRRVSDTENPTGHSLSLEKRRNMAITSFQSFTRLFSCL